jgi:glutathione transport system permease protein
VFAFLLRRLAGSLAVLVGVAAVVFFILHLTGDPAAIMVAPDATKDEIAAFRHAQGFDRPLVVQFVSYAGGLMHGDIGKSLRHETPALALVLERLPATMELAFFALGVMLVVAVPAGVISAIKPNSAIDWIARLFALVGQSAPTYWIGLMLILLFGVGLGWLPVSGIGGLRHLILPGLTLGFFSAAKIMRLTRASMLETLGTDYLRTAAAKGLAPVRVIVNHALRNAWLPIVTAVGIEFGTLLSGAIITESIFAWPGIGRLAVQAVLDRDFPVVEGVVLITATIFVLINVLVDVTYAALDPRIRYE